MANPFDDDGEQGYNPFADYEEVEEKPKQTVEPARRYDEDVIPAKPAQTQSFGEKAETKAPHTAKTELVDPVTGLPITEKQIAAKERALAERERQIKAKEDAFASGNQSIMSSRNFPPLLNWWSYRPDDDLPENVRPLAKMIFWLFILVGIPYVINMIGAFSCLGAGEACKTSVGLMIVLSITFVVIFWPLSFHLCYFVFYNAVMNQRGARFICSLVTYALWVGGLLINLIGLRSGGSVGFVVMIDLFSGKKTGQAIIGLLFVITGSACAAGLIFAYIKLIRWFRANGLSRKAIAEVAQMAANEAMNTPLSDYAEVGGDAGYA